MTKYSVDEVRSVCRNVLDSTEYKPCSKLLELCNNTVPDTMGEMKINFIKITYNKNFENMIQLDNFLYRGDRKKVPKGAYICREYVPAGL